MINIRSDSRKVKPGDIFVALKGISSNGSQYINNAIENGASKLIVEEEGNYPIPYEVVPDSRKYLENYLVTNYNKYLDEMTLIGITGTNGKTTTAFLLYEALNKLGYDCAYMGTIGFYLDDKVYSLPNTSPDITEVYDMIITAYDAGYRYMSLEISSHGLDMNRLEGISFDYAVFTNLTQDHLDYHKTMGNYALAKQKLFKRLKSNGKAFVNCDDKYKEYFLLEQNNNITYGFGASDYQVTSYDMNQGGTKFIYKRNDKEEYIVSNLLGKYNIYNVLVVVGILSELGFSYEDIKNTILKVKSPSGRMDMIKYGNSSIVIDYAHTPDAVEKIIKTMQEVTEGNIYTVFGCTGDRDRTKRPIMMNIVTSLSKFAIVTNDDPHNEDPNQIVSDMLDGIDVTNYEVCLDRKEAIIKGINMLNDKDSLLILGKGHEEVMIVRNNEKIPFNDRKVVMEYLYSIAQRVN